MPKCLSIFHLALCKNMCYTLGIQPIMLSIMNVKLVQAYVAKKVTTRHPNLAYARETMDREEYHCMVLGKKVYGFHPKVLMDVQNTIVRRFGLKEHNAMFQYPTLRQWISDITCTWSKEDILAYFVERSGLCIQTLQKATIGGSTICRDYLIGLVEELEDITGKQLGDGNIDDPLAYLGDNITYDEIAEFFSFNGNATQINDKIATLAH